MKTLQSGKKKKKTEMAKRMPKKLKEGAKGN